MTTQAYECSILMLAAYEMMLPARLPKFKYEHHKSPTFKVHFHAPIKENLARNMAVNSNVAPTCLQPLSNKFSRTDGHE